MTIKEQIAKAIILKFKSTDGKEFFEAYDLMSQEVGFVSELHEDNNFQAYDWRISNPQKEVQQIRISDSYTRRLKEIDEIINQISQQNEQ